MMLGGEESEEEEELEDAAEVVVPGEMLSGSEQAGPAGLQVGTTVLAARPAAEAAPEASSQQLASVSGALPRALQGLPTAAAAPGSEDLLSGPISAPLQLLPMELMLTILMPAIPEDSRVAAGRDMPTEQVEASIVTAAGVERFDRPVFRTCIQAEPDAGIAEAVAAAEARCTGQQQEEEEEEEEAAAAPVAAAAAAEAPEASPAVAPVAAQAAAAAALDAALLVARPAVEQQAHLPEAAAEVEHTAEADPAIKQPAVEEGASEAPAAVTAQQEEVQQQEKVQLVHPGEWHSEDEEELGLVLDVVQVSCFAWCCAH
jgi:hypothetical protein